MKAMMTAGTGLLGRPVLQGTLLTVLFLFQMTLPAQQDSLRGFNYAAARKHVLCLKDTGLQRAQLAAIERRYIKAEFYAAAPVKKAPIITPPQNSYSNCENLDFEYGSASGWAVEGDYELTGSGADPFGNFSKVYPNSGRHSLKLNNSDTSSAKHNFTAKAGRLLQVTKESCFINLHFAMVMLDYPHDSASAARFTVGLRDSSAHVSLCPRFNCYFENEKGAIGLGDLQTSTVPGWNNVHQQFRVTYSPWQTVGVDLSPYIGGTIFLTLSCNWCAFDVDWAYCYIDADCQPAAINTIACASVPQLISGPPGFGSYRWSGPLLTGSISAISTLNVLSAGIYTLQCGLSSGCAELAFNYIYSVNTRPDASFSVALQPCSLNAQFETYPQKGMEYVWKWSDSLPATGSFHVSHIYNSAGIKQAELWVKDSTGCSNYLLKSFTFAEVPAVHAQPEAAAGSPHYPGDKQHFLAVSNPASSELSYSWRGPDFEQQGPEAVIGLRGQYTLEAVDQSNGCSYSAVFDVEFNDLVPNIFTPDNNGVNDFLCFRTDREVCFQVFDRWGSKVHESKSENGWVNWDGKDPHQLFCSAGVFFYLLTPAGHEDAAMTGYFTLLR